VVAGGKWLASALLPYRYTAIPPRASTVAAETQR